MLAVQKFLPRWPFASIDMSAPTADVARAGMAWGNIVSGTTPAPIPIETRTAAVKIRNERTRIDLFVNPAVSQGVYEVPLHGYLEHRPSVPNRQASAGGRAFRLFAPNKEQRSGQRAACSHRRTNERPVHRRIRRGRAVADAGNKLGRRAPRELLRPRPRGLGSGVTKRKAQLVGNTTATATWGVYVTLPSASRSASRPNSRPTQRQPIPSSRQSSGSRETHGHRGASRTSDPKRFLEH
jgi:hypothetical protein